MNPSEFRKMCLGDPIEVSPEELYLYDLAKEYHRRTEQFDRAICSGPIVNGSVMPARPEEKGAVIRNALSVKSELQERAWIEVGLQSRDVNRAIQEYEY